MSYVKYKNDIYVVIAKFVNLFFISNIVEYWLYCIGQTDTKT